MKKIVLIANSSWNIYNFRQNIINTFAKANYEIVVIAPLDKYSIPLSQLFPIRFIPLQQLDRKSTNPLKDVKLILEFSSILATEKPDIVMCYTIKPNIYGIMAAAFHKIPSIAVITGLGYTFLKGGFLKKIANLLYRFALNKSSKVVFENIDDRLLFETEKIVKAEKCVSVKGCGIDIDYFRPSINPPKAENVTVFTFVGRFLYDKGMREFIEAANIVSKQYPNTRFELVGEIDEQNPASVTQQELNQWLQNEQIQYIGFSEDVRIQISNTDCLVMPSYREAIAKVIQEAMAMEKPVIATNVPGCKEAVDDTITGFLVPAKNSKALADKMIYFLSLSILERQNLGKAGRKKVVTYFDENLIATQYLNFTEAILHKQ